MKDSEYCGWLAAVGGGVMMAFAPLINIHTNPQTVFWPEWWMAIGCVWAWGAVRWVDSRPGLRLGVPALVMLLFMLVCLVRMPAPSGLAYPLYAGLFLMAYALGQRLDSAPRASWIAAGILLCAVLESLAGLAQLAGWSLGGLVMSKLYLQAFGNIGQANHYTDLIYLGLAALCYLRTVRHYPWPVFVGVAAWLCLAGAASASRGAWLYTAAFIVLGLVGVLRSRDEQARSVGTGLLIVVGLSVVAQMLVSYGNILAAFDVTSSIARASDAGSNGQRLYDWHSAVLAIQAHPLWGGGPGSFYKLSIDAMAQTGPVPFSKFAEHAHNLPLNLAAELGVPFAALLLLALTWWFVRHAFREPSARSLWVLAAVSVTGLHSMVEYPLWYTYFLVPIALCMGTLDSQDRSLPVLNFPRVVSLAVGAVAWGALLVICLDWIAVRTVYSGLNRFEPEVTAELSRESFAALDSVNAYSVFASVADGLRIQASRPATGDAQAVADRCNRVWEYKPAWYMMMRCGEAYALTNNGPALQRLTMALCEGFPKHHQPLREWATQFDGKVKAPLKLTRVGCLSPEAAQHETAEPDDN